MALINALLIRSGTGWTERTDAPSIALNTRFEAYLALGAIQTDDGVDTYADAQLDIFANPREEITAGIAPIGVTDTPYLDYQVGDVLTVPNSAGTGTSERVRAITVTENADTGIAVFTPTFKDFILERAEQIQIAIKKMSNGSLSGASQVAQPIRENFVPREVQTISGSQAEVPFVVVANDGTGDYDDPQAAINAMASGDVAVIYVKNTGTTYNTTGVTTCSGKKIVLWGISPTMRYPGGGNTGPRWSMGVTNLTMDSSTVLHVIGMSLDGSAQLGMVAGSQLHLDGASIGGGAALSVGAGTTYAYDSIFRIHSTSYSGTVNAWRCAIDLPNATMTLTTADLIWHDCVFTGGGSTNMTITYAAGSSGAQCSITDCDFGDVNALTVSGFNQATFKGNTNHGEVVFGPTFSTALKTLTFSTNDYLVVDSTMWGTTLTINASQFFNLGGIWHTTTIASDGGSVCATFSGDRGVGTFPTSTVTISGDHIVGSIFVNRGNTNGVLVSGDNNVLAVTQTNPGTNTVNVSGNNNKFTVEVGATNVDTGAGNVFL